MGILIVGADGSMGKRYQSILRYLNKPFRSVDKATPNYVKALARESDAIILACPTESHSDYIRLFAPMSKPILCEKPVTKNIGELEELLKLVAAHKTPLRMMYQYQILADSDRIGRSFYNYFKHGNDGMVWDCMQILGLARGEVHLSEDSPVWSCMINGKRIQYEHMDAAYIAYVQRWFQYPNQNPDQIIRPHERAVQAQRTLYG